MLTHGRGRFLNWLLGLFTTGPFRPVLYPVTRFLIPPAFPEARTSQVSAGRVNDPQFIENQFKIVRFGNEPVTVIKVADDDFRAFLAVCTHLDCIVGFGKDRRLI